jgi:hypothetical protein
MLLLALRLGMYHDRAYRIGSAQRETNWKMNFVQPADGGCQKIGITNRNVVE